MSFSDNLRQLRKEKGLSQEELAQLLEVSRQAVSKWESAEGYPEVEKLVLLSQKLNISLDNLLDTGYAKDDNIKNSSFPTEILISSPIENVIMKCIKVISSQEFKSGKHSPKYALYGVSAVSLLGENSTFLGWYVDKESITKELSEIKSALLSGSISYELRYNVKTDSHWGNVRIIQ